MCKVIKIDCKHRHTTNQHCQGSGLFLTACARGEVGELPKCKQHFQELTPGSGKGVAQISQSLAEKGGHDTNHKQGK